MVKQLEVKNLAFLYFPSIALILLRKMVKFQLEIWLALGFITYQRDKDELLIEISNAIMIVLYILVAHSIWNTFVVIIESWPVCQKKGIMGLISFFVE